MIPSRGLAGTLLPAFLGPRCRCRVVLFAFPAAWPPAQPQSPRARAIRDGIDRLRRHPEEDGRMRHADFLRHDRTGKPCDGAGQPAHDLGVTALALLALLDTPGERGPLLGCEAQGRRRVGCAF
jgi:hypothetical protein